MSNGKKTTELRNELIRPSRKKRQANAIAAMRLLDRRETIVGLENQLCLARTKLEQEEDASAESWRRVKDKSEQLSNDQFEYIHLYKETEKIREDTLMLLQQNEMECRMLDEIQHGQLLQMEHLEAELTDLTSRLEFLQNYQNTLSDVEGFDRVVGKFQELNQTWHDMTYECRDILQEAAFASNNETCHPADSEMQAMMIINNNDGKSAFASNDVAAKNKVARNSQWQIVSITESFKQHGHMYLSILNLSAHLASHPIARTLTNIGKRQSYKSKTNRSSNTSRKDDPERVPSVEQIQQPVNNFKERWKLLAQAAIGDGRLQVRPSGAADASMSTDVVGRVTDSLSVELQQKFSNLAVLDDVTRVTGASSKQSALNRVAAKKLNFIEQILYDLTLIKEEIEFQTDPIHYNEPGHSYA